VTELTAYTRSRIERECAAALRAADVVGVLPTPLDAVREAAGVSVSGGLEVIPGPAGVVLGALWFEERLLFVDGTQSRARRRFTEAHELVHAICPWHEAVIRLDTRAELFGGAARGLEAEANYGAGQLIFQGRAFADEASRGDRSLTTPFALATRYGASRQAAAHHFVASHRAAMAMVIAGRWPGPDGCLPIWRSVESPAFRRRFGPLTRCVPRLGRDGDAPLAEAIDHARTSSEPVRARLVLADRAGRLRPCAAEVVNNRHCHLVFVRPDRFVRSALRRR
jgi:uncharacterized protein DUF955